MNREDALYNAKHLSKTYHNLCNDTEGFWEAVINALEQEPTLEKIKAEIDEYLIAEGFGTEYRADVSRILDKYAEQEPTDEWQNGYDMAWEEAKVFYEQEPCDDVVSRQAVEEIINDIRDCISVEGYWAILERMKKLPSVRPQEPKSKQFAEWVAREIFDEMWEYNKDAFAEIACRKLAKLGIVREKGDVWELVEQKESEV